MVGIAYLANCPKHNTKISGAAASKSRSIDGSHILPETINALEGLSVRMSAVFCPSNWLVSTELHICVFFYLFFLSAQLLFLPFQAAFS